MNTIELMAPAGSFESLQAAIDAGADSVYFGVGQLNMRARATMNFTTDDLEEIAERCQKAGVKTYLTLNTIIYDHDLSLVKRTADRAHKAGIDAVIASDQAIIGYCASKGIEVHISTQLNVTNLDTVRFYSAFADVMVLSRELSMRQIKQICDGIEKEDIRGPKGELIEIEVFGHGALCVAVSGKCYMSLHTQNSSANRGACIQNCRRKYKVVDLEDGHELEIDNEYIMSPKDLCTIDFLDDLADCGIKVLKIEGRGRAPEYVSTVIKCYREAIDSIADGSYSKEKVAGWMESLSEVFNRGFWGGYYLGQELGEFTDKSGSSATFKKEYIGKGLHYYPRPQVGEFKMESGTVAQGDTVFIIGPTTGVVETTVGEIRVDDTIVEEATKGKTITFKVEETVRASDRLYKKIPMA